VVTLPGEEMLEPMIRRFLEALRGAEAPNQLHTRDLFQALVQPALPFIETTRLIIAADGVLNYLPFEALEGHVQTERTVGSKSVRGEGARYFGLTHSLRYVSSAGVLRTLSARSENSPWAGSTDFVGVAPVQFAEGSLQNGARFAALPYTEKEVDSVSHLFAPGKAHVYLREGATRRVFAQPSTEDCRYLHIATHGVLNVEIPFFSGLVLHPASESDTGFLSAADIFALKLSADVAVLSACETGLGRLLHGEGLIGLTQALLTAGVQQVIVSLWAVDDEATAQFMRKFYVLIKEQDMEPAEALRATKESFIAGTVCKESTGEKWTHPFFWAPFICVG
jgi:CHAT domain-containing protein